MPPKKRCGYFWKKVAEERAKKAEALKCPSMKLGMENFLRGASRCGKYLGI